MQIDRSCNDIDRLEQYKLKLIKLLGEMNKIMPVQFRDIDYDNGGI